MICSHCGRELSEGALFCRYCGCRQLMTREELCADHIKDAKEQMVIRPCVELIEKGQNAEAYRMYERYGFKTGTAIWIIYV